MNVRFQRLGVIGACVVGCGLAVGLAAFGSMRGDGWYAAIAKPRWAPGPQALATGYTALAAVMGLALAYVLLPNAKRGGRAFAVFAFGVQLLLNLAWGPIFFGSHATGWAMVDLVALWVTVAWTVAACWSVSDVAGVLLLPYWAWVTFVLALGGAIWRMN